MHRHALVLLLLLTQGCSLIFVSGPPDGHEKLRYFDCVSNGAAPAADASWAIFDGLLAAAAISADGDLNDEGEKQETGGVAALFGVAAAVHAGSMIYGLLKTDRCGDAKQHLQQRIADHDAETRRKIDQLELQLGPQAAPATQPQVLELSPPSAPLAPMTGPDGTAVPPPPDAYTQPPPQSPAVQPAAPGQPAAPVQPATPAQQAAPASGQPATPAKP